MVRTMTAAEFAEALGTDPKTARRFLRDQLGEGHSVVGKGSRYSIERRRLRSLRAQYRRWAEARRSSETLPACETVE